MLETVENRNECQRALRADHRLGFLASGVTSEGAVPSDLITNSTNGPNQGPVIARIDPAQVVNVDVHNVSHCVEIELPQLLDNRRACDRLPFVAHEELEESKFLGTKLDRMASALHGVRDAVDFQIPDLEHGSPGLASATENRRCAQQAPQTRTASPTNRRLRHRVDGYVLPAG
jgi:hypothetical protein